MDVHVENLTTSVSVMDDQALLSPAVLARIVDQVMVKVRESDRTQAIAQTNTEFGRAAGGRRERGW